MAEDKNVLGLMSGTSLDGLDLALVNITEAVDGLKYKIVAAETIEYDQKQRDVLANAKTLSGEKLFELHHKFGVFLGQCALNFLKKTSSYLRFDFLAWPHCFSSACSRFYYTNWSWCQYSCYFGNNYRL